MHTSSPEYTPSKKPRTLSNPDIGITPLASVAPRPTVRISSTISSRSPALRVTDPLPDAIPLATAPTAHAVARGL